MRGGVAADVEDVTPRPELLPLELLLFSSAGSSLLRVPVATGAAFQLGKNWAKSQSFSIYFRDVFHIQNKTRESSKKTSGREAADNNGEQVGRGPRIKERTERLVVCTYKEL